MHGNAVEDLDRLSCCELPAESTGHQLTQHRVQPAQDLGAQAGQIAVTTRPDPQHHGVPLDAYLAFLAQVVRGSSR